MPDKIQTSRNVSKNMNSKPLEQERVPADLHKALTATPKIEELWRNLTPVARRDFISWIESAKQPETRKRRIEITHDKLKAGKRRPCCYAIVPMNVYKALGENPKAKAEWKNLTPIEKRDFIDWIDAVKQGERGLRIEKACVMIAAGKRKP